DPQRGLEKDPLVLDHILTDRAYASSPRMHDAEAGARLGGDTGHLRLPLQAVHIVENMRTGCHGEPRGAGAVGVYGKQRIGLARKLFDHRKNTVLFLAGAHLGGAWTRRFSTNVENGSPRLDAGK